MDKIEVTTSDGRVRHFHGSYDPDSRTISKCNQCDPGIVHVPTDGLVETKPSGIPAIATIAFVLLVIGMCSG